RLRQIDHGAAHRAAGLRSGQRIGNLRGMTATGACDGKGHRHSLHAVRPRAALGDSLSYWEYCGNPTGKMTGWMGILLRACTPVSQAPPKSAQIFQKLLTFSFPRFTLSEDCRSHRQPAFPATQDDPSSCPAYF